MTEEAEVKSEEVTGDESLSDVFNDEEDTKVTEDDKSTETKESESEKGEPEKEPDKEPEKELEKEPEKEKAETPSAESIGLQAALVAERHKRQEAEKKLKDLEEPETVPDPIEDPTGYSDHIKAEAKKNLLITKIELSRDLMMDSKEDYTEKEKVFMDLIGTNNDEGVFIISDPSLFQKFQEAKSPARFAYDHAVQYLDVQTKSDPEYREKLKIEILAELQKEIEKTEKGVKATDVPNLTKASAGSNTTQVEKLVDLEDMFEETD